MDVARQLRDVKKRLKVWEQDFVDENNRRPGKEDIDAEQEIKDAYKQYASLKRQLQSSGDKDPNEGAWGADLNKTKSEIISAGGNCGRSDRIEHGGKDSAGSANNGDVSFMSKMSSKLFEKSSSTPKVQKPIWGLSRSMTQPKSDSKPLSKFSRERNRSVTFMDQTNTPNKESSSGTVEKENTASTKQDANIDVPTPKISFLSALDKVSIVCKSKPSMVKPVADGPLPFSPASGGGTGKSFAKRYQYAEKFASQTEEDIVGDLFEHSKPFEDCSAQNKKANSHEKPSCDLQKSPEQVDQFQTTSKPPKPLQKMDDFADVDFNDPFPEEDDLDSPIKSHSVPDRGQKRKASSEAEIQTPDPQPTRRAKSVTESRSRKTQKQKERLDEEEGSWENSGQSEVSWQPDQPNVELEIDLDDVQHSPEEQEEDNDSKPAKKKARVSAAKPISNDNFVRLNMKVKTYRRKGQGMTGGRYKRQQWKAKMKARSDSFGGDKCFKCGESGHWANKCTGKMKPKVPGMAAGDVAENVVSDLDFPTIREAIGMSRGTKSSQKEAGEKNKKPKEDKAKAQASPSDPPAEAETPEDDLAFELEIYRPGYEAPEPPPPVDPLYELEEDGTVPEPTQEVMDALRKFGFTSFRQGQKTAIMRILCGMSTLVILSTGSGKSLIYQLAAYLYATKLKAITMVISPLVSLMEDQVTGLPPGIKGACLHTNMTKSQRAKVTEAVAAGEVHFLLVSPEAMTSSTSAASLLGSAPLPPIAFVCIDEAHCVSEWSHHFRPSYLRICKVLRETYGVKCMLGLTATATMVTAASVAQHLGIADYKTSTIRDLPVPHNLQLSASRDEDKDQALIGLLQGDRFAACMSVIIYCNRRQETARISTLVRTGLQNVRSGPVAEETTTDEATTGKQGKGRKKTTKKPVDPTEWTSECYHAGLSAAQRKRVQTAFMSGRLRVVVATVAFGMGVDKSDVRGIIHYSMPKSFESYVQEIGRAGRDGKPSHCHVFLDHLGRDSNELKRHIYGNTIDRFVIKKLVKKFFPPCRCKDKHEKLQETGARPSQETSSMRVCPGHERAIPIDRTVQELDIPEEGISTLLCYLELHPSRWLINLQSVYATCTLQCYGGARQLQAVAKKCPPVAVAIAKQQKKGASFSKTNSLEFPVIDISDSMGWESGPVKRELKLLQWNNQADGSYRKSGVLVSFTDLALHLRSPGDLEDEEVDDIVSFLHDRVQTQERTELAQLKRLQDTLRGVSHKDVWMCSEHVDTDRSDRLKLSLREYFDEQPELRDGQVTMISFAREYGPEDQGGSVLEKIQCDNEDCVRSDIRQFVHIYSSEHSLSGRSIARIFHGIPSPVFPANVWGRVRRFWRCHLDVDFNVVRRLATQELIHLR